MCHYTKSTDFLLYIFFCLFKIYNVTNHDVVQSKLLQNLFNSQTQCKHMKSILTRVTLLLKTTHIAMAVLLI